MTSRLKSYCSRRRVGESKGLLADREIKQEVLELTPSSSGRKSWRDKSACWAIEPMTRTPSAATLSSELSRNRLGDSARIVHLNVKARATEERSKKKMEYQLEIYRPGSCDSGGILKVLTVATPFQPIRVGDLLNTKAWRENVEWPLLRVVNVEHLISENSSAGIDPSGRVTQRILVYTQSVPDTPETRSKSPEKI